MIPKNIERRIRQHIYAKNHDFFAIVQPGFENTAFHEISGKGISFSDVKITEGGIEFSAGVEDVWRLNFTSGCLTRILMRIIHFRVLYFEKLREKIESVPWELYLTPGKFPDLSIKCRHSRLYHSDRIKEEFQEGIRSRMEIIYPEWVLEKSGGNQTVYVRFEDDICTVSIDTTGEPLYRRGFRTFVEKAPMRETLASCILREADAESFDAVLDPMCGSGVIPLEAALISCGIPSGKLRHFAFEDWPGHRTKAFDYLKRTITGKDRSNLPGFSVYASDISERAIETANHNFDNSGIGCAHIVCADFFSLSRDNFPGNKMLIAMNPPYGSRMDVENVIKFYSEIGKKLRKDFAETQCAIVAPVKAEKALGISPGKRIPFINGGIRVVLVIGKC